MTGELRVPAALEEDGPSLVVHMRAPLDAWAVQQVCAALHTLLAGSPGRDIVCHVHGPPDVTVVGGLARLILLARRHGVPVTLRGCGSRLDELLALTGLEGLGSRSRPRPDPGLW